MLEYIKKVKQESCACGSCHIPEEDAGESRIRLQTANLDPTRREDAAPHHEANDNRILEHGHGHGHGHEHGQGERHTVWDIVLLLLPIFLLAIGMYTQLSPLLWIAYFLSGHKVLIKAFDHILRKEFFDEYFLISLATFGAIYLGELNEAVAVMVFFNVGEFLQEYAVSRSKRSIKSLIGMKQEKVHVEVGGEVLEKRPEDVPVGSILRIGVGERVGIDCRLVSDRALLDNSAITGESLPVLLQKGDELLAGAIVLESSVQAETIRYFSESAIQKMIRLVEESRAKKSHTERFITKFSKIYTPIVILLAILLTVIPTVLFGPSQFETWFYRALQFLVISCPCALVLSIPLGFYAGIGTASSRGILVKGGLVLETLSKVTSIGFDKTGTLTEGQFKVSGIHPIHPDLTKEHLLHMALLLEKDSRHPISRSILLYGEEKKAAQGIGFEQIRKEAETLLGISSDVPHQRVEEAGIGVRLFINGIEFSAGKLLPTDNIPFAIEKNHTSVALRRNKELLGILTLADRLKPDSAQTVAALQEMGIDSFMVTGDRPENAEAVGSILNLKEIHAGLLPTEKHEVIRNKKNDKAIVAFVGDGINDAASLAVADVGFSIGTGGSDVAIETSDIVLLHPNMRSVADAVRLARKTVRIVKENIVLTLSLKAVVMFLGTLGLSNMWLAILADVGVSLLAILNALRILRYDHYGKGQ